MTWLSGPDAEARYGIALKTISQSGRSGAIRYRRTKTLRGSPMGHRLQHEYHEGDLAAWADAYRTREGLAPHKPPVEIRCLGPCGEMFMSVDRRANRICPACKTRRDWSEGRNDDEWIYAEPGNWHRTMSAREA